MAVDLNSRNTSSLFTTVGSNQTSSSLSISTTSVETTNSSLGLKLVLSVNSTTIPSQDPISITVKLVNTLATMNNLTAVNDWAIQELESGPCDIGNATNNLLDPAGIGIFRGYYGMNNLTSARPLPIWAGIECINRIGSIGTQPVTVVNITSYSFLPAGNNGSVFYAGYYILQQNTSRSCSAKLCTYYPTPEQFAKGTFPTTASYNAEVYSANGTGFFNSLNSSLPATYTLAAGDEWGQIILLHFSVTPSHNLPIVGSFLSSPSQGGCTAGGVPEPCTSTYFSDAVIFNCASEAATSSGCVKHLTSGVGNYSITIWYPYVNQTGEPQISNCKWSEQGITFSYGYCFLINSTAFVYSDRF